MNELKPCPFCGRKAELGYTEKDSEYGETAFVYCTNCGANGKMIKISPKYCADEKAIEAWNRRANEDTPTVDVVKRKRSVWMENKNPFIRGRCSCCGWDAILFKTDVSGMPYCPNCGATMKGEEDDAEEIH